MNEPSDIKGNVLIIEDDLSIHELLRVMLKPLPYSLEFARCGHQGIDLYHNGDYCLIVTDINLPGLDGHYIANYVKERELSLPVIGMSGLPFQNEENFCHTFRKPFNVKQFVNTVIFLSETNHSCIKHEVQCHNL